jgi:hypothetical protein
MGYRVGYPHTENRQMMPNILGTATSPPNMSSAWMGFSVCKINNVVHLGQHFNNSEVRNESMLELIKLACQRYTIPDFEWILIHSGDHNAQSWRKRPDKPGYRSDLDDCGYQHFSPCTDNYFPETIPDFVYDKWIGTGVLDFESTRLELLNLATPPETDLLGWRGMDHHVNRVRLLQIAQSFHPSGQKMDCMAIGHHGGPAPLSITGSMTLLEQARRFRYLIDIEGYQDGYSGGLKLRLHAPRVVFIQERAYKEDFFQWLVPYKHYIPVKNKLEDLVDQLDWIQQRPELETTIIKEKAEFCLAHLTRDAALKRLADRLSLVGLETTVLDPLPPPPPPPPPVPGLDLQNPKIHEVW